MDLGDAAHRQSGQVAHPDTLVAGNRERQSADSGRLVNHEQHRAVTAELADQGSQLRFVLRQCAVQQDAAFGVEGDRVMS